MTAGSVAIRRSVVLAGLLAIGLASPALADRAFTARFSVNANGDVAVVGNTLESCQSTVIDCANARAGLGTVLNNNNFVMARVNVDSTTVDSSSARLTLPVGARVLFAGLYYGGRTNAGTGGKAAPDSSPAGLSKVDFRSPGSPGVDRLTAAVGSELGGHRRLRRVRRRHGAGAACRFWGLHGRECAVGDRRGPIRRLGAGGGL